MVETMVSSSHFQSQLASIMEMLAKTAVLEIGKLVEESHAVFKRELSRRISENESLKNKCDLLESELRASRRSAQKIAELLQNAKTAATAAAANKEVVHRPTIDGVFGKEWCMDLWKEKEPVAAQLSQSQVDPCVIESIDLMDDDGPEMIIINDEILKKTSSKHKPQADTMRNNEKGPAVSSMDSSVNQSGDDFITYTVPTDNMPQRSAADPTIDPRPSTLEDASTSSNMTAEEFGLCWVQF
ncbi:uncharacterized protein LOC134333454 isoform X2 [Trichomycterus rosablanca]|uniref:uncharacterized protein LOC134333454 isoform X2 n=1 Tax=Trichomycterus rosablanca TaxID=2290929 RepID=UPI002F353A06